MRDKRGLSLSEVDSQVDAPDDDGDAQGHQKMEGRAHGEVGGSHGRGVTELSQGGVAEAPNGTRRHRSARALAIRRALDVATNVLKVLPGSANRSAAGADDKTKCDAQKDNRDTCG